jgi:xanthine dehydrogenase large subunit
MTLIGKSLPHDSAVTHVTGESLYIDDIAPRVNEVFVEVFVSPSAHGLITSFDYSAALKVSGVIGVFTHKDLACNKFGPILQDEVLLAQELVEFVGQPIAVVAAESREAAREARQAIKVAIDELPPIFTVKEAIAAGQFLDKPYSICRGDTLRALAEAPHVLEGCLTMAGADHFYLESQACIAYPQEQQGLLLYSSTQNPSEVQHMVAHLLGLRLNQVVCVVKRMGGGFGGKECQATHPAAMAALVALKTQRPARIVYTKDDDMQWTGKRHPFENLYKVGFNDEGRILGLEANLYADGGAHNDLSTAVLGRALTHIDNAYFLENVKVVGRIAKTNLSPNTAFRGFGGPQGIITIENILEEIAVYLGKDALDVRKANLYGLEERNITHYGQVVSDNTLPEIFTGLGGSCDYAQRRKEIAGFNAASKAHLRGMAFTAVKFGISFTNKVLNQANALVNIYLDGSIQVSTGATEMGQGVNTNIKMLVADEFGLAPEDVVVMPTSTEKNNNTSATAASSATDLNGSAAVDACKKLKANIALAVSHYLAAQEGYLSSSASPLPNLKGSAADEASLLLRANIAKVAAAQPVFPKEEVVASKSDSSCDMGSSNAHIRFEQGFVYDERQPEKKIPFDVAVRLAYKERLPLGERGHYATKGIEFDWETGKGSPFLYFTNGAACSEVEIDRLTGQLKLLRTDILMDVGKSINPMINRGQILGAFAQGLGWLTTEELCYSGKGELLSHSPTTYKIPGVYDMPEILHCQMLEGPNVQNIKGTKAVGEPPLVLAVSVWMAVKNALSYVSSGQIPILDTPATGEEILMRLTQLQNALSEPNWHADSPLLSRGASWACASRQARVMGEAISGAVNERAV